MQPATTARILLTGATGFVGGYLWPELERAGYDVRGLTRNASKAAIRWPERQWIQGDVASEEQLRRAMTGCDAAYYLIHGMSGGDPDYRRHEIEAAERFRRAAEQTGLRRIVYLGGMEPSGTASEHLRSRLEVGEALRAGSIPAIELRASIIIGYGSLSWLIVRDLAARLPVMVLPRWLNSRTQPVALDDVLVALVRALDVDIPGSAWFDIPGPETLTGRQILEKTAEALGLARPGILEVPVLTPWLSSHWIHFVSRAEWSVARELVMGLKYDLLAKDDRYWALIGHPNRLDFRTAARRALSAERAQAAPIPGMWGHVERWLARRSAAWS